MTEIGTILELLRSRAGNAAVLVTLVNINGSSYRRPSARLLWFEDGARTGGISGGCLEEDVIVHAREVLSSQQPKVIVYDTAAENDLVWGTGTGCDGEVTLLLEYIPATRPAWLNVLAENYRANLPTTLDISYISPTPGTRLVDAYTEIENEEASVFRDVIQPPQRLLIFGAGDDAQPLVVMAATLGWQVIVADSRPAYATRARFPTAHQVTSCPPAEAWAELAVESETPVVIMTHRYRDDRILLPLALATTERYVGLLGSRKRAARLIADLAFDGFEITEKMRAILHAPVGLDLGGNGPASVALAILAEVQANLTQAHTTSLRDRPGPIHPESCTNRPMHVSTR